MMDLPDWQYGFALIPRTALKPTQSAYFAITSFDLPPKSYYTFYIGQGFSIDNKWIPAGQKFSIWWAKFSISQNSLIRAGVGVESSDNPGYITLLALAFGYGQVEFLSGIFFDFEAGTRPVYYIANYSDNTVTVDFVVFGVTEMII